MIKNSISGTFLEVNKHKYIVIEKPVISHETAAWFTPSEIKESRKGVVSKLRSIQRRALRRITGAYKATCTKALQVEINIAPIECYLEKLMTRTIATMNARESDTALKQAVQRIRKDLIPKRGRKLKLKITPLQLKRRGMRNTFESTPCDRRQSYIAPSWVESPTIIIAQNKEMIRQRHDADKSNPYGKTYSDENEKDDDVTAISVYMNGTIGKRLRDAEVALTHHEKLEGLTRAAEKLAEHCKSFTNSQKRVYKVYSDS